MKRRILVIGLDGASLDLIKRFSKEGKMPNVNELLQTGVSGYLKSSYPPSTVPAWNCFATGKNPGKLGIFFHVQREPGSYKIRPFYNLDLPGMSSRNIWDIISDAGGKVGLLNALTIYHPYKLNGFMVAGGLGSSRNKGMEITYPKELISTLDKVCDGYELSVGRWENERELLEKIFRVTEKRFKAAKYLMNNSSFDFFMLIFNSLDLLQHIMWKYMDPNHPCYIPEKAEKLGNSISKYYQKLDEYIGKLTSDTAASLTTVIVSDHGAGSLYRYFIINEWLRGIRLLKLKESPERFSRMKMSLRNVGLSREKIILKFRQMGFRKIIDKTGEKLLSLMREIVPSDKILFEEANIDWEKTLAYSYSRWGEIYVNLEGREPKGIVKPGKEYEEIRDFIIRELRNITDPLTGKQLDVKVFKKEEIYFGENLDYAPDLFIEIDNFKTAVSTAFGYDSIFYPVTKDATWMGTHRMNGTLVIHGEEVNEGQILHDAEIIDIAPTMLHLLDIPIPSDMDGKILKIFKPESELSTKKITYQKAVPHGRMKPFTAIEEEKIKKRLKKLGYLD